MITFGAKRPISFLGRMSGESRNRCSYRLKASRAGACVSSPAKDRSGGYGERIALSRKPRRRKSRIVEQCDPAFRSSPCESDLPGRNQALHRSRPSREWPRTPIQRQTLRARFEFELFRNRMPSIRIAFFEPCDFRKQCIGQCRLARAGAARNQQVALFADRLAQRLCLPWEEFRAEIEAC